MPVNRMVNVSYSDMSVIHKHVTMDLTFDYYCRHVERSARKHVHLPVFLRLLPAGDRQQSTQPNHLLQDQVAQDQIAQDQIAQDQVAQDQVAHR
jgi:hypothetical protein